MSVCLSTGGVPVSHNALQHLLECHGAAGGCTLPGPAGGDTLVGGYPGQGGTLAWGGSTLARGGTLAGGGYPGRGGTLPGGYPGRGGTLAGGLGGGGVPS